MIPYLRFAVCIAALGGALAGCQTPRAVVTSPVLRMPDGTGIAADVVLPPQPSSAKVPVVLIQTRYWRSFRLRGGGGGNRVPIGPREPIVDRLVQAGFGVVIVDVRGTGASDGAWRWPWSEAEVRDMGPVLDWIVAQPWSNGVIGATGVSYEGTTALLSAAAGRPALRAVLARQIEWSLVDELLAPGGVRNVAFVDDWAAAVDALDHGRYPDMFPAMAKWFVTGVQRRGDDAAGQSLAALQRARTRSAVNVRAANVRASTDRFGTDGPPTDSLSPSGYSQALSSTKAVVAIWGSWWDGATADAVFRAASSMPIREAVIGPWAHEGTSNGSPLRRSDSERPTVDLEVVVAFFRRHLMASTTAPLDTGAVRRSWYVAGAERWESATQWPATRDQQWYLVDDRLTETAAPGKARLLDVDYAASTGNNNRWTTGLARPVDAPNRAAARGVLAWQTTPLRAPLSVFGVASFHCAVSLRAPEAALHVYVEAVNPSGEVRLLTEGTQRISSGAVTVRIRPVAFELPTGWSLRLSVAGADRSVFERVPASGEQRIRVAASDCRVRLPVRTTTA